MTLTEEEKILMALDAEPPDPRDVVGLETSVHDAVTTERLRKLRVLVIDEVSMLDAELFDYLSIAVDRVVNYSEIMPGAVAAERRPTSGDDA